MKKGLLLFVLMVVLALFGCANVEVNLKTKDLSSDSRKEDVAKSDTVMITDDCGRSVNVPEDIESVVPSGPLAQMVLYSLAPEKMVALASKWQDNAKEFIPQEYYDLPVLGTLYGSADLNVEELASTNPQLILDIGEGKKSIAEDMDDLQNQTRIPSVHVEATLRTMPDAYRKLGQLLGKEDKAEELAAFCEKILSQTDSLMEAVGENKVTSLYILGEEGLNVLANGSFHAEIIDLLTDNVAVVDNPAGKGTGNEATIEQVALWNPEYIIFAPESIYGDVKTLDTWKELDAVSENKYIEVPGKPYNWMGNPPSVQRYLGMIWLASELYPEYCEYDAKSEIIEYYMLFYDYELSDEQYEELMINSRLK